MQYVDYFNEDIKRALDVQQNGMRKSVSIDQQQNINEVKNIF